MIDLDKDSGAICAECGEPFAVRHLAPCADRKVRHRLCTAPGRAAANTVRVQEVPRAPAVTGVTHGVRQGRFI